MRLTATEFARLRRSSVTGGSTWLVAGCTQNSPIVRGWKIRMDGLVLLEVPVDFPIGNHGVEVGHLAPLVLQVGAVKIRTHDATD